MKLLIGLFEPLLRSNNKQGLDDFLPPWILVVSLTVKAAGHSMRWLQTPCSLTLATSRYTTPQTVLFIVAVETGRAHQLSSSLGVGLLLR